MSELPSHWRIATLGDVAKYINGRAFKEKEWTSSGLPIIRIQNLNNPDAQHNYSTAEHESRYRVQRGDLLVAWAASLGAYIWRGEEAWLNQHIFRVEPRLDVVDKQYLFYALKNSIQELYGKSRGSGIVHVTKGVFEAHPIPLPPIAEQKRIAEKLDRLLAAVDTCRARLDAVPAILKRFRQSVLATATSGALTEEWRAGFARLPSVTDQVREERKSWWVRNADRPYLQPQQIDNHELPLLPESWGWMRAEEACALITKGTTPARNEMRSEGVVPYIKVYNLTFDGELDFSTDPTFVSSQVNNGPLARSQVFPGDVLMNIVGPPLGKVSIVPPTYPVWNINQAIAVFRPMPSVLSGFLGLCLQDTRILDRATRRAKATAGQFNLTLQICRDVEIPVPPLAEQREICRRVAILFDLAARVEANCTHSRASVERVAQGMLAKAFCGELLRHCAHNVA